MYPDQCWWENAIKVNQLLIKPYECKLIQSSIVRMLDCENPAFTQYFHFDLDYIDILMHHVFYMSATHVAKAVLSLFTTD